MSAPPSKHHPGREAVAAKGWLGAHRWLLTRRLVQLSLLGLFLAGPLFGFWIVKGNLASSLTLDLLPLSDPFVLLQSIAARHWPEASALLGAGIVLAFYLVVGGRSYCAWACPINIVTDTASWLRRRLGLYGGRVPPERTRHWLLAAVLIAALLTGTLVWEWINPVTLLHRALVFGLGSAWFIVLTIFIYDTFIAPRGWCGHLCPMGAFYKLLGHLAIPRIAASKREACNDCMDCFAVCPEPQVIRPALKAVGQEHPLILSSGCTNCGRCIDVCSQDVFRLSHRFSRSPS